MYTNDSNIYDSTQEENCEITPDSHINNNVKLTNTSTENIIAVSEVDSQIALNRKGAHFWQFKCKLY